MGGRISLATMIVAIGLVGAVAAGASAAQAAVSSTDDLSLAKNEFGSALGTTAMIRTLGTRNVELASAKLAEAETVLKASRGRTPEVGTWIALADRIDGARRTLKEATAELAAVRLPHVGSAAQPKSAADYRQITRKVESLDLDSVKAVSTKLNDVVVAQSIVRDAVNSWAAQRKVTEAARIRSEARPERVWAAGFQSELNACRGSVILSAEYGVPTIGEKWGCGGSQFPQQGAYVRLTGKLSGIYRVGPVRAVLDASVNTSLDVPRGYDLLYQTCRNGNFHTETFTQLTRVAGA